MSPDSASPTADAPIGWPGVSVVIPVLDEQDHLAEAVAEVLAQDYPGPLEVILALGPSRDGTDEIAEGLHAADQRVRLVANPGGRTPTALNRAIRASSYPVVVRVDAHGMLSEGYLRTAVQTLRATGAANVGGVMLAQGRSAFEQAVARAMTTPLGVGSARWHTDGSAGPAETVYLGAFRRDVLTRVGGYDERFVRAQDWELNYRIRQEGELVWFTPELRVSYRPRPTLRRLARQYFDYGRWRRVVARWHRTISPRYLAAPAAVVGVGVGLLVGALVHPVGYLLPVGYAGVVLVGSALTGAGLPVRARLWLPVVYVTMHGAWGLGFLTSPPGLVPDRTTGAVGATAPESLTGRPAARSSDAPEGP